MNYLLTALLTGVSPLQVETTAWLTKCWDPISLDACTSGVLPSFPHALLVLGIFGLNPTAPRPCRHFKTTKLPTSAEIYDSATTRILLFVGHTIWNCNSGFTTHMMFQV
ncbi:hypothetical protein F5B18DRAFT_600568, partial [Nemania serpens]